MTEFDIAIAGILIAAITSFVEVIKHFVQKKAPPKPTLSEPELELLQEILRILRKLDVGDIEQLDVSPLDRLAASQEKQTKILYGMLKVFLGKK